MSFYNEVIKQQVLLFLQDYNLLSKLDELHNSIPFSRDVIRVLDVNACDCVNNKDITFNIAAGVSCSFKCCPEHPEICQNNPLCQQRVKHVFISKLVNQYVRQKLASSITIQGLEPLDNLIELLWFLWYLRKQTSDAVFVWTGYTEEEAEWFIKVIKDLNLDNIFIKFGRFVLNGEPRFDDVLGVVLASSNQYCKKIS